MGEYVYKGYMITEDENGYYWVNTSTGDSASEFESFDAACDWIDSADAATQAALPTHTFQIFYIDDATDRGFEARIQAHDINEALRTLYDEYDVYQVTDWDVLD